MGALTRGLTVALGLAIVACSPEARRTRDGGMGADPGNKRLVVRSQPDPRAADTTLWPGRNPAPVERLARGLVPPPTYPSAGKVPVEAGEAPIRPNVAPTEPQQRTFDQGQRADPRRQTGTTE